MKPKLKRLLRQIKKIDPEAAEYIRKTVIPRYYATGKEPPAELTAMFLWSETRQGNEYWKNIYLKLRAER
jgi:hypothetical protein